MDKILAVDDSPLAAKILAQTLTKAGYGFISCASGTAALALAASELPDIIVLDVVMPDITGLEVLDRLKRNESTARIPVVMLTSRTDPEEVAVALEAGAFDYIRKPIEPVEVLARIRSALRVRDYQERLHHSSTHDSLTGLLNHGEILAVLERELAVAADRGQALSVAMLDIDRFRSVNDRVGHQAGDAVLRDVGAMIDSAFGQLGHSGRYGGEEFLVVLRNFDSPMAAKAFDAFRKTVGDRVWKEHDGDFSITISVGVASEISCDRATADTFVNRADTALAQAKTAGPNRLETAP